MTKDDLEIKALATVNAIRRMTGHEAIGELPKGDATALGCSLSLALPFGAHCFTHMIHTKPEHARLLREVFRDPSRHPFAVRMPDHLTAFQAAYIAGEMPWLRG